MYKSKQRYDNLQLGFYEPCGKYDIPKLEPVRVSNVPELISYNYANTVKDKQNKGVHFFVDDYQFLRLWNNPSAYVSLLSQFQLVFTPDFSLYTDFPKAMQIYNHYRKHWLGAYWQALGVTVVPTICWGDESSFDFCFDGEPVGGAVAVSSVGTQNNTQAKQAFLMGYNEMINRLNPEMIIFYGNIPDECKGNFVRIRAFQEKFREVKRDGR